jgi:hypothetical protein
LPIKHKLVQTPVLPKNKERKEKEGREQGREVMVTGSSVTKGELLWFSGLLSLNGL